MIFITLLSCSSLMADTIIMRNGTRYDGTIINQSRTSVTIRVDGRPITVQKSAVARISYGPTEQDVEEERKKQEELRKKREEELKRLEEARKQRLEEEQKKKDIARQIDEWTRFRKNIPGKEDESEDWILDGPGEKKSAFSAIWRSAVFPGWGHWYLEENTYAASYAGLTIVLLALAGNEYDLYNQRQAAYDTKASYLFFTGAFLGDQIPGLPSDQLAQLLVLKSYDDVFFEPVQAQANVTNQITILTGLVYLTSLAHTVYLTRDNPNIAGFPLGDDGAIALELERSKYYELDGRSGMESNVNLQLSFPF